MVLGNSIRKNAIADLEIEIVRELNAVEVKKQ